MLWFRRYFLLSVLGLVMATGANASVTLFTSMLTIEAKLNRLFERFQGLLNPSHDPKESSPTSD